ncbi:MAG: hypothetical protein R2825_10430 [Saprospiraceae bacterium]
MEFIDDIANYLSHVAKAFLLINIIIFIVKYKMFPIVIKVFGCFLFIDFLTEILAMVLFYQHVNNLPLLHFYTLLEFVSLSMFYKYIFKEKIIFQKYFWFIFSSVFIFIVLNSIFFQSIFEFNSNAKTLVQLILIGCAVYYFFNAYGKIDLTKNEHLGLILINGAIIIYNAGSLFVFMFSNVLLKSNLSHVAQNGFWLLNSVLFLLFQLLILFSLWKITWK